MCARVEGGCCQVADKMTRGLQTPPPEEEEEENLEKPRLLKMKEGAMRHYSRRRRGFEYE